MRELPSHLSFFIIFFILNMSSWPIYYSLLPLCPIFSMLLWPIQTPPTDLLEEWDNFCCDCWVKGTRLVPNELNDYSLCFYCSYCVSYLAYYLCNCNFNFFVNFRFTFALSFFQKQIITYSRNESINTL